MEQLVALFSVEQLTRMQAVREFIEAQEPQEDLPAKRGGAGSGSDSDQSA